MGTVQYIAVFIILARASEPTQGLTCRLCYYAQDLNKCGATTQCPDGELCGIHEFTSNGASSQYHAGCLTPEVCVGTQAAPIQIFGRRRKRQAHAPSTVKIQCCDTDLCNKDADIIGKATTATAKITSTVSVTTTKGFQTTTTTKNNNCTEHPECIYLIKNFQICSDTYAAQNVCPISCGVCGSTISPTVPVCKDMFPDCGSLIEHFQACSSVEFSLVKCQVSCNLCNGINTGISNIETPVPSMETPMPNIETPMPNIETPIPSAETPIPNIETPMPSAETPIPNIETPKPNKETPVPNMETPMPSRETP